MICVKILKKPKAKGFPFSSFDVNEVVRVDTHTADVWAKKGVVAYAPRSEWKAQGRKYAQ